MKNKSSKARQKRWFKKRIKEQYRKEFHRAWRQHFVDVGILPK